MKLYIGIDPGTVTGIGSWNPDYRKYEDVTSMPLHSAMDYIKEQGRLYDVYVRVEDARQRKWFGDRSHMKKQGAGAVKRDSKIWEDFLTDMKKQKVISGFSMVHPMKNATKLNAQQFQRLTGWSSRTNEHARDAAMLVYNFKCWE